MVKFNSDVVFLDTSGQVRCEDGCLTLRGDDSGLADIIVGSGKSLRPETDCNIDLGLDYLRWRILHACSGQLDSINGLDFSRLLPVDARPASGNIIPDTDSVYLLGSSSKRWGTSRLSRIITGDVSDTYGSTTTAHLSGIVRIEINK